MNERKFKIRCLNFYRRSFNDISAIKILKYISKIFSPPGLFYTCFLKMQFSVGFIFVATRNSIYVWLHFYKVLLQSNNEVDSVRSIGKRKDSALLKVKSEDSSCCKTFKGLFLQNVFRVFTELITAVKVYEEYMVCKSTRGKK